MDKIETDLFDLVCRMVWAEGGDGAALILVNDFKSLANRFDEWRKNDKYASRYYRDEGKDYVCFSDRSNENIVFSKEYDGPEPLKKNYMYEVIIKWGAFA